MFYRKNYQKILLGLLALCLLTSSANALPPKTAQTPEQSAVVFYKWYIGELNKNKDPRTGQKQKLLSFLSKRFGKWIYSIPEGEYGADAFIDAQDWNPEWVNAVSTSKAIVKGNTASLTVTLGVYKNGRVTKGMGKHVLRLKMIKEGGAWKINHINDY